MYHEKNYINPLLGLLVGILVSEERDPYLLSRIVPCDVVIPAQMVIQKLINKKLSVSEYPVTPKLLMDKNNNLKQYLVPQNLLSAMWFQFFQAASGERKFKKCEICHKWEDVTEKRSSWSMHPNCAARVRMRRSRKGE